MRVKTFFRILRIIAAVTLFFFSWSFGPIYAAVAYAAEGSQRAESKAQSADPSQSPLAKRGSRGVGQTSGERFEKALDAIRENVGKLALSEAEGAGRGDAATGEIEAIKKQRAEIAKLDADLKKEFAATEKKLKDAKLPQEILDRHAKFVKRYEDNVAELKTKAGRRALRPGKRSLRCKAGRAHRERTEDRQKAAWS